VVSLFELIKERKMKIRYIFLPTIILFVFALTACGGDQPPADIDALYTAAAQTLGAQFTQQALSQPSATPTFTLSLPPTAQLPSPTDPLVAPTATFTPTTASVPPVGPTLSQCDVADFIDDITIPDGTEMAPGTVFTKTWRVKNIGTCTWNANYKVIFYFGEPMSIEKSFQLTTEEIENGENLNISINMTAPSVAGEYYSHWRMQNDKGEVFGIGAGADSIYAQIKVVAGANTQTPTPENTPTATEISTTEPPPADTDTPTPTNTPEP
jgi:hypothetical protein